MVLRKEERAFQLLGFGSLLLSELADQQPRDYTPMIQGIPQLALVPTASSTPQIQGGASAPPNAPSAHGVPVPSPQAVRPGSAQRPQFGQQGSRPTPRPGHPLKSKAAKRPSGCAVSGMVTAIGQIQAPQTQTITVSASARGLQINTDTATVTFRDDQSDPPLTLSVRFSVLAPCLNVNTTSLYFDPTKANPQYVTLTNCSARENWTASIQYQDGNSGWLSITPGYGTLEAGASQVLTVSVSVSYPMSGIYHATIYLIDGSYETSISVTLSTSSPHG